MDKNLLFFGIFGIFCLLLFPSVYADEPYHMTLLAVSEAGNNTFFGSTADLFLEVREGTGKVLMETFPLTKSDTQLSTRFAKEMSCKFLDMDCSRYDFVYTIRASSPIIGGPSAGAAIAGLTVAALSGLDVDEDVALTGTINSGGLIGNVGGVKEKIAAAQKKGLKKVLIPFGEIVREEDDNKTINFTEYGNEIGIEVKEVVDLNDVVFELTGEKLNVQTTEFDIDDKYSSVMETLSEDLCKRSRELLYEIFEQKKKDERFVSYARDKGFDNENFNKDFFEFYSSLIPDVLLANVSNNTSVNDTQMVDEDVSKILGLSEHFVDNIQDSLSLYNKSVISLGNGNYYSAASFCFGANVKLNNVLLREINYSMDMAESRKLKVEEAIRFFEETLNKKKYKTITDFQTYMIVKERLIEAKNYVEQINSSLQKFHELSDQDLNMSIISDDGTGFVENQSIGSGPLDDIDTIEKETKNLLEERFLNEAVYYLSFAVERLYSAKSWYTFYDSGSTEYDFSNKVLEASCISKINEVEERVQYIRLFMPPSVSTGEEDLRKAKEYQSSGDYELCLFKATLTKAQVNVLLSMFGVSGDDGVDRMLELKLEKAREVIATETMKGRFPILGYSYYEYGESLSKDDKFSALLYAEYALELSDLDIYFKKKGNVLNQDFTFKQFSKKYSKYGVILIFVFGILLGFLSGLFFGRKYKKSEKKKKLIKKTSRTGRRSNR